MSLPKRVDELVSHEKTQKMPKLVINICSNLPNSSPIQELELALDRQDCNLRALYLTREVAKTPDLPLKLTMRLLKFCAKVGSERDFQQIVNNQTVDLKTLEAGELLWAAVNHGWLEIATMLIRSGVDLSARELEGKRTLLQGVLRSVNINDNSKKEELIRLMLVYGTDINARDGQGYNVLHDAIGCNRCPPELVEMLLEYGADVMIHQCNLLDHLFWASRMKPQLLLRLIEHQVPNEKTRNQRGVIVIKHLINGRSENALLLIKKILDLGVPVDTDNPFPKSVIMNRFAGKGPLPLLSLALFRNKIDVVELLLEYGADPRRKNAFDQSFPLFQAAEFKSSAYASSLLIKYGANIHAPNDDGRYPIHEACKNQSFSNTHLLLNLGVDVNVTNKRGFTPFQTIKSDELCGVAGPVGRLMIKHFALTVAKGRTINCRDLIRIQMDYVACIYYRKCTEEIRKMKSDKILHNVFYYHSLLSDNLYAKLRLMRNDNFLGNFEKGRVKRMILFPEYSNILLDSFIIAKAQLKIWSKEIEHIKISFRGAVPDLVAEIIAKYSCLENMERCRDDYFMSLHDFKTSEANDAEPLKLYTRYNCACPCTYYA